jgi:hypothetical protein
METIFIYFLKVNGLLIVFYLLYYFLLRKETFFVKNRFFLLFGLVASLLLPLVTFTKTVWIETRSVVQEFNSPIIVSGLKNYTIPEKVIDWNSLILYCYIGITAILILKILLEIISFYKYIGNAKKENYNGFTLIDSTKNNNPFSFLHYIVIHKTAFSDADFNHILAHEKVHVMQNHSVDVILSKIICSLFWINPIIWMYKKSMLQNLEFIADEAACNPTSIQIEYQKTLLQIVTNPHQLKITNQFYQSLIKKRIIMLNKNRSHQNQTWKYFTLFPAIALFIFMFQIETVAQEKILKSEVKDSQPKTDKTELVSYGVITFSSTTDNELAKDAADLKILGIKYNFSNLKRNSEGEIIAIKIEFDDLKGNKGISEVKGNDPIEPIYLNLDANLDKIGFTKVPDLPGFKINQKTSGKFGNIIKVKEFKIGEADSTGFQKTRKLRIVNETNTYTKDPLWIINGKEYLSTELPLDKIISSIGKTTELSSKEGFEIYGEKGKNGVVILEGVTRFIPNEIFDAKYKNSVKSKLENKLEKIENSKPEIERTNMDTKISTQAIHAIEMVSYSIITDKNTTDLEFKKHTEYLKKEGIDYKISNIKRNSMGEIIAIKITFDNKKGKKGVSEVKTDKPINPIYLNIGLNDEIGFTKVPN